MRRKIVRRSFAIRGASAKAASRLQCCGGDGQNTCYGKQRRHGKQKTGGSRSEKKETMNIHSVVCVGKEKLRWMVNVEPGHGAEAGVVVVEEPPTKKKINER